MKKTSKILIVFLIALAYVILAAVGYLVYLLITVVLPILPKLFYVFLK